MAQQPVPQSRPFVHVVFTRTQAGSNGIDILLKNSTSGEAGPEWVLCGGELMQEEMPGFKDKEAKNKTLLLAALRVAAVDAGHCADMPETDFAAIGGKKERLPPSLMANKRMQSEKFVAKAGARTFVSVCKLDAASDGDYATGKWKPCSAAAAKQQQTDCKWYPLADLLKGTNRVPGVASWVPQLLDRLQSALLPNASRMQSNPQSPNARQNGGPMADAAAAAVSQGMNKPQGNMMHNATGGYAPESMPGPYAAGGYPQQQQVSPGYGMPYVPQMEMPQQSSLKFKFPAHIISLVVRTTGCRLGRDKLVAIGAAFVKVPNSRTLPQILEKRMFQCQVDAQEALDANCMTADELKQLQGEAKPTAQAVAQVVAFVKDCMRQDHDSFIAANNPMVELGMLELAAAEHCEGFTSLSRLAEEAGGGNQVRAPIDLGSLACGLVSTDTKPGKHNMGRVPKNGAPWATLSEYLQLQTPDYDARPESRPPVPQKNGRLDPHDEAVDKGWHFGNTLCILADKHSRAGMGLGMMGMANNPAMMQALFQQQQMHMMQQQQQVWQQMQQMQLASAYQQQNYNAPHQQSHSPHHRMPPHNKQHRQYGHNAGRGAGGYHQGGLAAQGMGMGIPPHVQQQQQQQQFSNARGNMPTHDVPQPTKPVVGSADGMGTQMPAAGVAVMPFEGQGPTNESPVPQSNPGSTPVAAPAVAESPPLEQGAPAPAVVAAQQPLTASVPQTSGEPSGGANKESVKTGEAPDAKSNAAAASSTAPNSKQDTVPKSWAQMASKPPQNKSSPPVPVAAPTGHSEGAGGAAPAAEGAKDAGRREPGADAGEQRPAGHRREAHGRNEGSRKDSAPGGDRGGGKGKGHSVGGAGRGDVGGRPSGQQAGRVRAGNSN